MKVTSCLKGIGNYELQEGKGQGQETVAYSRVKTEVGNEQREK